MYFVSFLRHNASVHLTDYSTVLIQLLYVLGNQRSHLSHLIAVLTLLWLCGTKPTVSLRCACYSLFPLN